MRAALLLNGEKPNKTTVKSLLLGYDYIAAADGAYDWANKYGITTNIVLGDMDSKMTELPQDMQTLKFSSDKDMTDGEIGVDFLIEKGFNEIDIYGAGGKRDDHAMANYFLLQRAKTKHVFARLITNYTTVYLADNKFSLDKIKNKTISILPFSGDVHIMNTEGLQYSICNKHLTYDSTLGVSNVAISEHVEVDIISGTVLIYVAN